MDTIPPPPRVVLASSNDDWTSHLTEEQRLQKLKQEARVRGSRVTSLVSGWARKVTKSVTG